MKGVKKCCGLLSLLAIMLGLSLSVCSGASALKHKVNTIDFGNPNFGGSSYAFYFGITYDTSLFTSDPYSVYENYVFRASAVDTDSSVDFPYYCSYAGEYFNSFAKRSVPGSSTKRRLTSEMSYTLSYITYSSKRCDYLKPYSSDSNHPYYFQSQSLPLYAFGTPNLALNLPYRFNVSGVYINADLKMDNGLLNQTKLEFSQIFGHAPYNISRLTIPFGVDTSKSFGDLESGRGISLEGSFMFDSDNFATDVFTLTSESAVYNFHVVGGSISLHDTIPCSMSVLDNRSNESEYPWELSYKCSGFLTHSYSSGEYYLALDFQTSDGVLWSYPARTMSYEGSYLVLDGDDTMSDLDYGAVPVGSGVSSSPGYPSEVPDGTTSTDWFSSLTNMFNFSLYNPFAPLFSMFLQPESCVDIPIIAGMINSTESTYCSWWPASIRNILTPVFGLSSVMLVFGFAVRWLGSSSGNMFEDQTSHKWGNTQIKSKGAK